MQRGIAASQGQFRKKKHTRLAAAEAEKWAAGKAGKCRLREGADEEKDVANNQASFPTCPRWGSGLKPP